MKRAGGNAGTWEIIEVKGLGNEIIHRCSGKKNEKVTF